MFNSIFLSIAISLVFLFLLLAIMVTAINEIILTFSRSKARQLEFFLKKLFFEDRQWIKVFNGIRRSPFITVLKKKPKSFPSSIPPENFSTALLAYLGDNTLTIEAVKKGLEQHKDPESEFYTLMKAIMSQDPDIEQLRKEVDKIFNNAMDRLTGWYKLNAKILSLIVSLLLCASLNIDSITITRNLYNNKDKAEQIASFAATASKYFEKNDSSQVVFTSGIDTLAYIKSENTALTKSMAGKAISGIDTTGKKSEQQLVRSYNIMANLDLPIGWTKVNLPENTHNGWKNFGLWLLKLLGIIITAAAVSLGAPFWFDILNKVSPMKSSSPKATAAQAPARAAAGGERTGPEAKIDGQG